MANGTSEQEHKYCEINSLQRTKKTAYYTTMNKSIKMDSRSRSRKRAVFFSSKRVSTGTSEEKTYSKAFSRRVKPYCPSHEAKQADQKPKQVDKKPKQADQKPKQIDQKPKQANPISQQTDQKPKQADQKLKQTGQKTTEIMMSQVLSPVLDHHNHMPIDISKNCHHNDSVLLKSLPKDEEFIPITSISLPYALKILKKFELEGRVVAVVFDQSIHQLITEFQTIRDKFEPAFGRIDKENVFIKSNLTQLMPNLDEAYSHQFRPHGRAYIVGAKGLTREDFIAGAEKYSKVLYGLVSVNCLALNLKKGIYLMHREALLKAGAPILTVVRGSQLIDFKALQQDKMNNSCRPTLSIDRANPGHSLSNPIEDTTAKHESRSSELVESCDKEKLPATDLRQRIPKRACESDFVAETLSKLLKFGQTVITINNLPADLTVHDLNSMIGTKSISQEQVVAITSSEGKLGKHPGFMNVRLVVNPAIAEEIDKSIAGNGFGTENKHRFEIKKSTVKELEAFLAKYQSRIRKLVSSVYAVKMGDLESKASSRREIRQDDFSAFEAALRQKVANGVLENDFVHMYKRLTELMNQEKESKASPHQEMRQDVFEAIEPPRQKIPDHVSNNVFVAKALSKLLKFGQTVITINNLPADLTVHDLNSMIGTKSISQEQVVAITSSKGKSGKHPGFMNVRLVVNPAIAEEVDRFMARNGFGTENKHRKNSNSPTFKKSSVQELETFLAKYRSRIRKLMSSVDAVKMGDKESKDSSRREIRQDDFSAFEAALRRKVAKDDLESDFVSKKLTQLLKFGQTVIIINHLPADLTIRDMNLMFGTQSISQEQVVAITSSNGKSGIHPGLMNVRVVMNSAIQGEVDKLLSKNGLETKYKFKMSIRKTDIKELESFLTKYRSRIRTLVPISSK